MVTVLHTAIGAYPHTAALRSGAVTSGLLRLDFAGIKPANRAFAPMVREARFDVCEMAIATYVQAIAFGKPLVLLPVVLAARFQESALLCRTDSTIRGPNDLPGRRIGVRAYSQTTGVWLRGTLADQFGIQPRQIQWMTFEDAHVAEYQDPDWTQRAPAGADMLAMLRGGDLDAVIVGNDPPDDAALRTVFPDPDASAAAFRQRHGFVPVNHLLTVRRDMAADRPDLVMELVRMFRASRSARQGDLPVFTSRQLRDSVALAARYCDEQGLLPRRLDDAEIWAGIPDEAWPD